VDEALTQMGAPAAAVFRAGIRENPDSGSSD
jgi:hypothetical protein